MTRMILAAALLLLPAVSSHAACDRVGTQIVCDWSPLALTFGTQTDADEPTWPIRSFSGRDAMTAPPPPARSGYVFEVQGFANDPADCRRIGNEVYCY